MTTIKGTGLTGTACLLAVYKEIKPDTTELIITYPGRYGGEIFVPTDDLLSALGAVRVTDLDKTEEAKLVQQVRAAEAKAALHVAQIHALEEKLAKAKGDFRDQVEKRKAVEGKLERVDALVASFNGIGKIEFREFFREYRRAVEPAPFVLPTEVPARIEVRGREGNHIRFALWTNGDGERVWINEDDWTHQVPDDDEGFGTESIMADFTGHRILEAGE